MSVFVDAPFILAVQDLVRSTAEARWTVFGVSFSEPWFLVAIPLALALVWRGSDARSVASARVPTIGVSERISDRTGAPIGRSGTSLAWVATAVRMLSVALVLVGLSRPLQGKVSTSQESEGIDIALLLDRSSSMDQRERAGGPRRFDIVRDVVADFAERRMTDTTNARDNVALFGFAAYADLLVPFTLDSDSLQGVLEKLDIETDQILDGTAIGGALAEAVKVLQTSDADSRVAVLLTDGEETVHFMEPLTAAKLAVEAKVRVYTVFAGPRVLLSRTLFGDVRRTRANVGDLPKIAEMTGGRFFHAESKEELEEAYAAIEELERTPRTEERFAERYDLYPFLVGPALLLYLLSWILSATVGRRLP